MISPTGWKELEPDDYKRYSIKKHGNVARKNSPSTQNNLPDIYLSSS